MSQLVDNLLQRLQHLNWWLIRWEPCGCRRCEMSDDQKRSSVLDEQIGEADLYDGDERVAEIMSEFLEVAAERGWRYAGRLLAYALAKTEQDAAENLKS